MIIRVATVDDATGIGQVHVRSWQHTYRGHMPQEHLDGLQPEQRAAGWRRYLQRDDRDGEEVFVAEDDGNIAGFAAVGRSRDDDLPTSGELRAIYVDPECLGLGYGRELMKGALDLLRRGDYADALLWVLAGNERAQRFYSNGGWQPDGATKRDDQFGFTMEEVRYRIDLRQS